MVKKALMEQAERVEAEILRSMGLPQKALAEAKAATSTFSTATAKATLKMQDFADAMKLLGVSVNGVVLETKNGKTEVAGQFPPKAEAERITIGSLESVRKRLSEKGGK